MLKSVKTGPARSHIILMGSLLSLFFLRVIVLYGLNHPLFGDEAQYWMWSKALEWGYFSKPPFIAFVIKVFTSLSDEPFWIRLPFLCAHFVTAFGIRQILKEQGFRDRSYLGALFYLCLPGVFLSSQIASTDPLLLIFWSWGMVFAARLFFTNQSGWSWIALGICMGLGLLTKYAMIWFVLGLVLSALVVLSGQHRSSVLRKVLGATLIACAMLTPNVYWNFQQGWITFIHTSQNIGVWNLQKPFINVLTFLVMQVGIFGPLASLYLIRHTKLMWPQKPLHQFLWMMSIPLLLFISFEAFVSRAYGNWASPAFIAITLWYMTLDYPQWFHHFQRSTMLNALLGIIAILIPIAFWLLPLDSQYNPYERLYTGQKLVSALKDRGILKPHETYIVLNDNRSLTAQLLYLLRNDRIEVVRWNPQNLPLDYFAMKTRLQPTQGRKILFVGRWCLSAHAQYFQHEIGRYNIPIPAPHFDHCVQELSGYINPQ